jgi:hypothetical protein
VAPVPPPPPLIINENTIADCGTAAASDDVTRSVRMELSPNLGIFASLGFSNLNIDFCPPLAVNQHENRPCPTLKPCENVKKSRHRRSVNRLLHPSTVEIRAVRAARPRSRRNYPCQNCRHHHGPSENPHQSARLGGKTLFFPETGALSDGGMCNDLDGKPAECWKSGKADGLL